MRALVGLLLAVLAATLVLWFGGARDAAWWMSMLGTFAVLNLVMAYVVFFDSRKRWPTLSWRQRCVRVLTFGR